MITAIIAARFVNDELTRLLTDLSTQQVQGLDLELVLVTPDIRAMTEVPPLGMKCKVVEDAGEGVYAAWTIGLDEIAPGSAFCFLNVGDSLPPDWFTFAESAQTSESVVCGRALVSNHGSPVLFITPSAADYHWPQIVRRHIAINAMVFPFAAREYLRFVPALRLLGDRLALQVLARSPLTWSFDSRLVYHYHMSETSLTFSGHRLSISSDLLRWADELDSFAAAAAMKGWARVQDRLYQRRRPRMRDLLVSASIWRHRWGQ